MSLAEKKCVPCEGGTMPLTIQEAEAHMKELKGWTLSGDSRKISKEAKFKDFAEALAFANKVGAIAEAEGHHPDLYVAWGKCKIEIWSHKIKGLTEGDFSLAAKADRKFLPLRTAA